MMGHLLLLGTGFRSPSVTEISQEQHVTPPDTATEAEATATDAAEATVPDVPLPLARPAPAT